jgi:hypothetical protein
MAGGGAEEVEGGEPAHDRRVVLKTSGRWPNRQRVFFVTLSSLRTSAVIHMYAPGVVIIFHCLVVHM